MSQQIQYKNKCKSSIMNDLLLNLLWHIYKKMFPILILWILIEK